MNRKSAVVTLVITILIIIHVAEAQTKKIARIGWLSLRHGPTISPSFIQGLRELGWFVGDNIAIETRFAEERYDQLPKLAAELVQLNVDVIVAADTPVIRAAKNATQTIPIVMSVTGDPVSVGHVDSLARPGGNITGLSNDLAH
jgi:putative tryptophan/tyrosine transport system substrate-binding protein